MVRDKANAGANGPIRRPSRLVDDVYEAIYSQLMSLKIAPGGRLSVDSLVRELGVSQTPIREALSRLEAQGLVVKTHLIGYSAAGQIDEQRFAQLYELRLLLEPFAAARAATHISDDALALLERDDRNMRAMDGKLNQKGYAEFARYDSEFHDRIAAESGNAIVHETLMRLHTHVHLFRLHYHARATIEANEEHQRILAALKRRDPAGAEAAMRDHIERSQQRFRLVF
ncbi:GntR family transcriptional regulator [Aureimonas populi]|uniref:GntR family transcriptional regulator n=1 Tax=Aureimonas populi TaxID=1701758 RepID=A0ABW5CQL8_9HYPH|nr:GntR family transcriptional regulator [Aureimonas populi]